MSWELVSEAYKHTLGTTLRKALIVFLADKASDDGSGIFTSKPTMAATLDAGITSIKRTLAEFKEEGLITEIGTRKCPNGYTIEYRLNVEALEALPLTSVAERKKGYNNPLSFSSKDTPSTVDGVHHGRGSPRTGSTVDPHPVHCGPLTLIEPIKEKKGKRDFSFSEQSTALPQDWKPEPLHEESAVGQLVAKWNKGRMEVEVQKFSAHQRMRGNLSHDWQSAWIGWVLNGKVASGGKDAQNVQADEVESETARAPVVLCEKSLEGELSAKLHKQLALMLGNKCYRAWIAPCALVANERNELVVYAPSQFHLAKVKQHYGNNIEVCVCDCTTSPIADYRFAVGSVRQIEAVA
jgi:DnaA N-terminal domain